MNVRASHYDDHNLSINTQEEQNKYMYAKNIAIDIVYDIN